MLDMAEMLTKIATGGWAAFDEGAIKAAQAREESLDRETMRAEAEIVRRALDNDAGRAFLEWLMSKTLLKPASAADLEIRTIEERALKAERELGAKQLVLTIYAALAVARGEDADAATDPSPAKRRKPRRSNDAT